MYVVKTNWTPFLLVVLAGFLTVGMVVGSTELLTPQSAAAVDAKARALQVAIRGLEAENQRLVEINRQLQAEQEQRRVWLEQNPSKLDGLFQAYRSEILAAQQRQGREAIKWIIIEIVISYLLGLSTPYALPRIQSAWRRLKGGNS